MTFAQACVAWALEHLGAPYIWAGQGEWCGRKDAAGDVQVVSVNDPEVGCPPGVLGVDCAGLVKRAARAAGSANDFRAFWGAHHLFWFLPEAREGDLRLVFYGQGDTASHVEFDLGNGLRLGANGGDSRTLTYAAALKANARVRIGFERRLDRLGSRSLEAVKDLPMRPPEHRPSSPALPTFPTRLT